MSIEQQYIDKLAVLTGTDFQAEVCALLQSAILDFQEVPSKPFGDAGLDGFSHGGSRAYCCYGLERDTSESDQSKVKKIREKFRSDLRRLLEVKFAARKLVRDISPEMQEILPEGQKILHVQLIVNWFESHRVLGRVLTDFGRYKLASECRYVDENATIVLLGPTQLVSRYRVDEGAMVRATCRTFVRELMTAAATAAIADASSFDTKIEALRSILPEQSLAIDALADELREKWRMSLAFEDKLHAELPSLHQLLERDRGRILEEVAKLMIANPQAPWTQLTRAGEVARDILASDFGRQFGGIIPELASGELARLIGECPVGWKAKAPPDA